MGSMPTLPACGRPATNFTEVYSHPTVRTLNSLVAGYFTCDDHVAGADAATRAAGLYTWPIDRNARGRRRCGSRITYTDAESNPPSALKPVGRRTVYDLVHAGIVSAGLPVPETIAFLTEPKLFLRLGYGGTAAVDRWAAWLGLPAPTYEPEPGFDVCHYATCGVRGELPALPGWSVEIACITATPKEGIR